MCQRAHTGVVSLASPAWLWHCDTALSRNCPILMPPFTLIPRTLVKTSRLLASWLLVCACASLADAAPGPSRHPRPALCSSKLTLRTLLRKPGPADGAVARRTFRIHSGLPYTTTLSKRPLQGRSDNYDEAIQDDAPAARIHADEDVRPVLQPLGVLASSVDRLPSSSVFSPRSPRGPPRIV